MERIFCGVEISFLNYFADRYLFCWAHSGSFLIGSYLINGSNPILGSIISLKHPTHHFGFHHFPKKALKPGYNFLGVGFLTEKPETGKNQIGKNWFGSVNFYLK